MPKKFIGMHFFNPVPALKLVEIIRGIETSDETYEAVSNLAERLELPLRPRAQDSVLRRKPQHTLRLAVLRGRLLQGRRRSDGQVLRRPVFVPRLVQANGWYQFSVQRCEEAMREVSSISRI